MNVEPGDESLEAVAARLEAVREFLGLSKRDFSGRAGITEQTYNGYTKPSRQLSLESARRLKKTYGLPLDFLFYGETIGLPMRYEQIIVPGGGVSTPSPEEK